MADLMRIDMSNVGSIGARTETLGATRGSLQVEPADPDDGWGTLAGAVLELVWSIDGTRWHVVRNEIEGTWSDVTFDETDPVRRDVDIAGCPWLALRTKTKDKTADANAPVWLSLRGLSLE